ncbi:MAG: DUF1826 domain-containing protein [Zoogloeaceae bacterium]|nr:DUF1826 domain-containing protein [Zoogloeaceae bacterium]
MAATSAAAAANHPEPVWRRVPELADLVEIFDPGVQVCAWQRDIDPAISTYLAGLPASGAWQAIETLKPGDMPRFGRLPEATGRAALIEDLELLRDIVRELLGCDVVGLRVARIDRAMCPGWHVDHTGIRLVCTYQGPGTEWLDAQDVDRRALPSIKAAFVQATPGEIVLLKGSLWQDNEAFGAVHRSPAPSAVSLRTLVTLDPLWDA